MVLLLFFFFFFKQKTAYEMRISDWSSDVCSSDLEIDDALDAYPEAQDQLSPLTDHLKTHGLIELQENYGTTFDRNPSHSLHLFEHVHGESRDREIGRASCRERVCQYV